MRNVTVKCDMCGFEKMYNEDNYGPDELKGWASITVYGQDKDVEICPECVKSFINAKEERDDD